MGYIKKLDGFLVSKIAAGEVLQGVYSVVKELVENSIDAGSSFIEAAIDNGGLEKISIRDDGNGILPEDLELAVTRYATSKIEDLDSLFNIETYGFRGEALASVLSVSRFEIKSSVDGKPGYSLSAEGGKNIEIGHVQCPKGTYVTVRDIFFNVPARRKFLKTPSGEALKAKRAFACLCLSNPGIGFSWRQNENKPILAGKEDDLIERYCVFFQEQLRDHMMPFEQRISGMRVYGILGEPEVASKKPFSPVFVNKRCVSDKSIAAAVRAGYGPLVFDRLPVYAVFVEIDPSLVDVNVHPSKENVKFSDASFIFREVKRAVSNVFTRQKSVFFISGGNVVRESEKQEEPEEIHTVFETRNIVDFVKTASEISVSEKISSLPWVSFFQIHNSYILVETKGGFLLIDQHAAAERILYEEVLYKDDPAVQILMFPVVLNLDENLWDKFIKTKGDMLYRAGFRLKMLSRAVSVDGVPSGIENASPQEIGALVKDILSQNGKNDSREKTAAMIACKASVKAGDKLQHAEIENLVGRLFLCRQPHVCPHGRPTIVRITLRELEKRFGRSN
ncbi:DNA mismatch repair endonuclease MutL [candidate division WOR-3 bacterium]|nr:DNA mismatch repair endonuclease MutL [candidate division WOR-3 bacterium]